MKLKKIIFVFVCVFLANISFSESKEFGLVWEPYIPMDNQLFPSYVWANATRTVDKKNEDQKDEAHKYLKGDQEGQIGVKFTNLNSKSYAVKILVECEDIMFATTYESFTDKSLVNFEIFPEISYKFDKLKTNLEPKPINVKFSVFVNGVLSEVKFKNIILRSINDCPFTFIDAKKNLVDLNFMYAAYVNENNPRIANEILPKIIEQGALNKITGYQLKTEEEVYKQVFAVWNYFKDKGTIYSSLSVSNNPYEEKKAYVQYQYVRTLDESLNSSQANCVDGTVAMASVLFKMGIRPMIITTPNHCFLAYNVNSDGSKVDFLETTLLGEKFSDNFLDTIPNLLPDVYNKELDKVNYTSYRSFLLATNSARNTYFQNIDKFNSFNAVDRLKILTKENMEELINKLQFQAFSVAEYRQKGLLPINSK